MKRLIPVVAALVLVFGTGVFMYGLGGWSAASDPTPLGLKSSARWPPLPRVEMAVGAMLIVGGGLGLYYRPRLSN